MARLSHPPDLFYTTPASKRTSNANTDSESNMPSSPLSPTILLKSLKSHGNDDLPASPPSQGSKRSSLSPADCHTLGKILCNTASPPATPSPLDQSDQLFSHGSHAGTTNLPEGEDAPQFIGGEATDIGYEDEDDSMGISEAGETSTAQKRLQESVSVHDAKDKLRLKEGYRSYTTKREEAKLPEQQPNITSETVGGDEIGDVVITRCERALPERVLNQERSYPSGHAVSDDINQMNHMDLCLKEVLEKDRVDQELAEDESISDISGGDFHRSILGRFDADNEEMQSRISHGISGVPRRKTPQDVASESECSAKTPTMAKGTAVLVPSTPTPAMTTPELTHVRFATTQSVPETPFTKTLAYFKQYRGAENFPLKRRPTTNLPQELSDVVESIAYAEVETADLGQEAAQAVVVDTGLPTVTSAMVGFEAMAQNFEVVAQPDGNGTIAEAFLPVYRKVERGQAPKSQGGPSVNEANGEDAVSESSIDAQKQMILYPQHPPFINAIGMIPATMFWVTAAPVVKYTSIAVDLLIDKLRDTYL